MNYTSKSLFILCLAVLSSKAHSGTEMGGYFPPNNHGNYINIDYISDEKRENSKILNIESSFSFTKLDRSPRGTMYVATQFDLVSRLNDGLDAGVMYIGVNPTQVSQNYPGQVHFSYFGSSDVNLLSSNCHKGADDTSGVTCVIDLPTHEGYTYKLISSIVSADDKKTLVVGIVQVINGDGISLGVNEIGKFEIITGNQLFANAISWVEGTSDPCDKVVTTDITFYPLNVTNFNENYKLPIGDPVNNACGVKTWSAPDGIGTTMEYPASQ
ncbi:hypothetical protein F9K77_05670 [Ochrobactrum sp. LMG 5442]|nr:hypothetical protein F9K77_05670 [Ochrobactrum sp. LMG 5442]